MCNCESSHCTHHDALKGQACTNKPDGTVSMMYVGKVCRECADNAIANGGAMYIFEKGEQGK